MYRATFLLLIALSACSRPPRADTAAEHSVPPPTRIPSDATAQLAEALPAAASSAAVDAAVGGYALIRDSATLARVLPSARLTLNFAKANVLAVRVHDGISAADAAPRILARRGFTFVSLPRAIGPARSTGRDRIELYRIPLDSGPVRYVAYGPQHERPR